MFVVSSAFTKYGIRSLFFVFEVKYLNYFDSIISKLAGGDQYLVMITSHIGTQVQIHE